MRMLDYASEIRAYRKRHEMTQEALAEILGVQAKYVSLLENAHRRPGTKLQKKMEELITADELEGSCERAEMPITKEEIEVQMRIFRRLCKFPPVMREHVVDLICQILDMMSTKEPTRDLTKESEKESGN
ncbi:MAG: helix-turn-helix transcriptional regulator [Lachnospiraceae bacterium]|nr:helix-turn-helix transcriptional regulator [Lachnospiraceae bacterium]